MPRNAVIVNKGSFTGLPEKSQVAVKDCAAKAELAGLQKSKDANDAALATLKKNGVQVMAPAAPFAAELQKIGATMTDEWVARAGGAGASVISAFKK